MSHCIELSPPPGVADALRCFAHWPDVLLFDSARTGPALGRYSFLSADPFDGVTWPQPESGRDPFAPLRGRLEGLAFEPAAGLPPFQGGAAGLLGYELGGCWERLPVAPVNEFELPALVVGLYDWVLAWDHVQHRAWIVSQGWPETDDARRQRRADQRAAQVLEALNSPAPSAATGSASASIAGRSPAAPQHALSQLSGLTSNFSRDSYLQAVERVIEYIRAGDIYQANLSQRLLYPAEESPAELYQRLRERNPAPFAAYFAHDDWTLLSASPERFLQVQQGVVSTRPIKGTRQRRHWPEADLYTQDELQVSSKDVAENVMIVDLLRNDLSRVCRPGSIRVPQLCRVESFETVHHLVSEITGELAAGRDAWDLLAATFPGGSITGCPKVRAMEIITELEQVARGAYCGSLFYLSPDGTLDSSILIRTITQRGGWLQLPVGGGVVAPSDPAAEYAETLHKAEGLLRALRR